ncbi:pectinesterase inhibitor 9-like [Andrographis paniculata]|uniref:pectinesterase inhibitor 9-like n=1 Tax=Andrographis paniculata TaxID=175694 RepID=UPI0021E83D2D|nr:pectinesterase inhibitor 9-like [Andrographis paniculata]
MKLKSRVFFFLLSLVILTSVVEASPRIVHKRSRARSFIEAQCKTTLYYDLCVRSLSYYLGNYTSTLSRQSLAQFALKVSLVKAHSTKAYVMRVTKALELEQLGKTSYYLQVKECLDQINDGVKQLTNCIKETQKIQENGESTDFRWRASNVMTWMSAAETDASTCINGISGRAIGGKTKATIKAKLVNLEQSTSIALALFNGFAARYKSSHVH